MPFCPNGHGQQPGKFCTECGAALAADPPGADSVRIRSPESHATASVNPTFFLPGAQTPGPAQELVKCPKCGRRNAEAETFHCQGECGRENLCLRHFDEEYDVCLDCARALRGANAERTSELDELRAQLEELRRHTEASAPAVRQPEPADLPLWQQIGIEMVRIPAGSFLYGEYMQSVYMDEFFIAKTPVTNLQYKAFVDATGFEAPEHWDDGCIPAGKEQHPVVYVSWEDATEFCEWAGVRLPSEREWEKAARGTDGREYPWGDEWEEGRCNSDEAGIDDTSSVFAFAGGASPYGVLGMEGNVAEWCASWYDDDRECRVVRGGPFVTYQDYLHCACRFRNNPNARTNCYGFRMVSPGF